MSESSSNRLGSRWRQRGWQVTRSVLISAISLGLTVIILEIGFRLRPQVIPQGACKSSLTLAHTYCDYNYVYDDPLRLGYIFKPGYAYDGPWNPADPRVVDAADETCSAAPDHTFHYHFKTDNHGFVNNATPWADHYDVVISGDSFTRPWAEEWWIDLLRANTQRSVLNLGMDGWGPLSEIAALRDYGLAKQPDWVVLMYFEGNDLFGAGEYQRRLESGLTWRAYQLAQASAFDRLVMPHVLRYWAYEISAWINPSAPATCRFPMTVATNQNRFKTIFYPVHIAQLSAQRNDLLASREWALTTTAIRALRDDVMAQGGRFLLVYIPTKERLYWSRLWEPDDIGHFLELTTPLRSYQEFSAHLDDQAKLMTAFAAANGIEFIDLSSLFWEATMLGGQEYYNYADVHWNSAGNRLVAETIGAYIQAAETRNKPPRVPGPHNFSDDFLEKFGITHF